MMELVTVDERKMISEKFVKVINNSDYMSTRIVDMNRLAKHIQEERRASEKSMIINIQIIHFKKGKDYAKGITFVKDSEFDVVYGLFTKTDTYGNLLWSRIEMSETLEFNLNNLEDAKKWAVVRMYPYVKGSPFTLVDPIWEVHDPSIEAAKISKQALVSENLFKMIGKMRGAELVETSRYLGITVNTTMNASIIKSQLLQSAMKDPIGMYDRLSLKTKGTEAKVRTAISLNILKDHPEKGIMFNENVIGLNINDAVNKLMSSDDVTYKAILELIEEKDILAKNIDNQLKKEESKTDKVEM